MEKKYHTLYYSCHEKHHIFGTGFVVRGRARQLVMRFTPINQRLCYIRLRGKFFNFSLINCHAPTEVSPEEDKEAFYEELGRVTESCPKNDVKIILGDFNAQVGKEVALMPTIGTHSLHETSNDNGLRMVNFATLHGLVVGTTLFPRKNIHKATWISPNGQTASQIDHVLISARHKSNMINARSYRGANMDTDHYLSIAEVRSRISLIKNHYQRPKKKIDVVKLKDSDHQYSYQQAVETKLNEEVINDSSMVDEQWKRCSNAMKQAAEESLGYETKSRRPPWFDAECLQAVKVKNEAYRKKVQRPTRLSQETYRRKRREEKRLFRGKRRAWENKNMEDTEALRGQNESRLFFQRINEGRAAFRPRVTACKDTNGTLLSHKDDVLRRWVQHFKGALNRGTVPGEVGVMKEDSLNSIEPPDEEEMENALRKLKNGKAPGPDGIQSELLKCGGEELKKALHDLMLTIWEREAMPTEWATAIICPIHKKGDQTECANYRGISLLSCAYKLLSNILFERILPYSEKELGKYQAGFRRGRSTTDQLFSLRMILEKTMERKVVTHHLFLDFKAAYDSVDRTQLYCALEELSIPQKLVRLIKMTMDSSRCRIRVGSDDSEEFKVSSGVRQGDALACLLFNLAEEKAVRDSGIQTKDIIFNRLTQLLGFADDIDIIGRSERALREAFISLEAAARPLGLEVNERKTKYMRVGGEVDLNSPFEVGSFKFERVKSFISSYTRPLYGLF